MNLTALALNNSRVTISGILVILAVGIVLYLSYPSAEDPTITIREASVTASNPGMSPERVEELITKPLEAAMREIAEIDEIKSSSKFGSTKLKLKIRDDSQNLDSVFQDIRNKAADVAAEMPEGTSEIAIHDDEGLTAIATIALWADGFTMTEMRDVARDIRDHLYTLKGVRRVDIFGEQPERIYLETTPAKLARLGVSPQVVFGALAQQNIIAPGGTITADSRRVLIEPTGNFESDEEIENVVFRLPDTNRVMRLGDVVNVRRTLIDPPQNPSFLNDKQAIVLAVSTIEGTNNVEFGDRLSALVDDFQQGLPIGYVLEYATYQPELIATAVDSAVSNVYQTLAIVLVVVMVFLGVRTGLIVGFFVPMTMLLGIIVMRILDVELQRMSIAATIIALGLLVDNAIVVAEDIRVRLENGMDRAKAAISSGGTLAVPLLTSSLTTILAFMPMMLIDGSSGEYVRSLAQVVTILLLGSWLLSMTVTPAMCAWFMTATNTGADEVEAPKYQGAMYRIYRVVLGAFLKFRLLSIAALIGLLVLSVNILGTIKTEFFPLGDRNQFLVYLDFESGNDVRETQSELRKLTSWLADTDINPEVTSHIAYVGYGGPRFFLALSPVDSDPHRAFVVVNTKDFASVGPLIHRVNAFMDANIAGARSDAKKMWFGGSEPGLVQIKLIGPDGDVLNTFASEIMDAFYAVPGTVGIKQDWENKVLKLVVDVDQTRARRAGVSSEDVAKSLQTVFSGTQISDYREGDKTIPIVLRGDDELRFSLSGLQRVEVYSSANDEFVALDQVANVRGEWTFSTIKRVDQQRAMTVEARNPNIPAPQLYERVRSTLEGINYPAGYRFELEGEIADQAEANEKLFGMLPLALAGIVILLVGQFNSFRKGSIIILTIPLILIGGTVGLVVMGAPYGFMVLLGFFSLAGILINNGIVLIDRIQEEERAGRDPLDAVVSACLARLRPILMATLTTVLGLVPLILFGGALFYGMASVIAWGLVVATIFTLGFVPALYTLFFKIGTNDAVTVVRSAPAKT